MKIKTIKFIVFKIVTVSVRPSNGVILLLKPSDTLPDPHGPLAESVSPSTIEEANEALTITSTANNTSRVDL